MKPQAKVKLNYEKTKELRDRLWQTKSLFSREKYERSDFIYCPLKGFNRMLGIQGRKPSMKVVASWVIGEALHLVIQRAFKDTEVVQELMPGVNTRLDILWDRIAEIKTTKFNMFHPSHVPESYLKQLEFALAFREEAAGYLVTLDIRNNILLVWDVEFSLAYLAKQQKRYRGQLHLLKTAVEVRNPYLLSPNLEECPYCIYLYNCSYFTLRKKCPCRIKV